MSDQPAAASELSRLPPHLMLERLAQMFSEGAEPAPAETPAQKKARRQALFASSLTVRALLTARGVGPFLARAPISASFALADFLLREKMIGRASLPDPTQALGDDHAFAGLVGLASDLTPETLIEALASGLLLDARIGAPVWWAPATRAVAHPSAICAALSATATHGDARFAFDANFEIALRACRRRGLVIESKIMMALCALFDLGMAHSWEVRDAEGKLRAGGVGLAIGHAFICVNGFSDDERFGRFGLVHLAAHLEKWNYAIIEAQALALACSGLTAHAGFGLADRAGFQALLALHLSGGRTRLHWRAEDAVAASLSRATGDGRIAA